MSEPYVVRFESSYSSFCCSLRGQYSSIIFSFSSPQVMVLASTIPSVCTWLFHQERAACMNVHAAYLTWQSAMQLLIWKTDSVFSNHRVNSMTPPFPAKLWGLQFKNSLYEQGRGSPPLPPEFSVPPPPPLPFLGWDFDKLLGLLQPFQQLRPPWLNIPFWTMYESEGPYLQQNDTMRIYCNKYRTWTKFVIFIIPQGPIL